MADRFIDGDDVLVKFHGEERFGVIVGRMWPHSWFVDFGKPFNAEYPFRVVLALDHNVFGITKEGKSNDVDKKQSKPANKNAR